MSKRDRNSSATTVLSCLPSHLRRYIHTSREPRTFGKTMIVNGVDSRQNRKTKFARCLGDPCNSVIPSSCIQNGRICQDSSSYPC
jgi:hypothetical protein